MASKAGLFFGAMDAGRKDAKEAAEKKKDESKKLHDRVENSDHKDS